MGYLEKVLKIFNELVNKALYLLTKHLCLKIDYSHSNSNKPFQISEKVTGKTEAK